MKKLLEPSKKLASRILTEVEFEDRLMGYRLRERTGPVAMTLYSFSEVVGLLNDPLPRIDFNRLAQWIREVMGDAELAGKIQEVIEEDCGQQERLWRIKDLMEERLLHAKKIVEKQRDDGAPSQIHS
jgi:hypothetical protein